MAISTPSFHEGFLRSDRKAQSERRETFACRFLMKPSRCRFESNENAVEFKKRARILKFILFGSDAQDRWTDQPSVVKGIAI
ncbi:hypothetical protein [Rhizobium leguminosarum]|uniref:hypothetical protein n=1 Tax=Rhizobium leguminosarum TaxID=384 RepID=UPI0010408E97|nr:hypothetical protein [Rhizobium leguminosarum]TBZ53380.1 hypothetical protein E0H44_00295 [Rhizobium leguminosarum bv. viciae]TCA16879.1 hypothetical protein E0H68_07840 [Rhizobium leguminosarum bv. viciae]TCA24928.1 hypothetical protein E0H67_09695 [Rhizobium leguminosarum bv. viciae]